MIFWGTPPLSTFPLHSRRLLHHAAADILYAASAKPAPPPPRTPLIHPPSPSPAHPPRLTTEGDAGPAACLQRAPATLATTSRLTKQRSAVWLRAAAANPESRRWWRIHGRTVHELYGRPRGADGLADGPERHEGRPGLCGAKCLLPLSSPPPRSRETDQHEQFNRYVNISTLKHYFNVSNSYVLTKLAIVLFPWRHRPWSRQSAPAAPPAAPSAAPTSGPVYLPPREDVNSPDMYIPLMAFVTYILLSTLIAGVNGRFEPQLLGITFSNASVIICLELLVLWLGRYFLNISSESQIYDLVAYSGYKFVGVIVTIAFAAVFNRGRGTGGWVGWVAFAYTFLANAFFLVCPASSCLFFSLIL